ncbi:adenosine deaminase, partial [Candidatus Gottesmanbacteria bacterium]|nr:adenosine deaminase [Candidatus Gottesmanbacteria bacterium]
GAKEMWEVVTKLEPDRIGHGIHAVDDPKLMKELAKRNITLEVCPSSNIRTQVVHDWRQMGHILQKLFAHGVSFCVNSDGPELVGTNVQEEYERLLERKCITEEQAKRCLGVARQATFVERRKSYGQ